MRPRIAAFSFPPSSRPNSRQISFSRSRLSPPRRSPRSWPAFPQMASTCAAADRRSVTASASFSVMAESSSRESSPSARRSPSATAMPSLQRGHGPPRPRESRPASRAKVANPAEEPKGPRGAIERSHCDTTPAPVGASQRSLHPCSVNSARSSFTSSPKTRRAPTAESGSTSTWPSRTSSWAGWAGSRGRDGDRGVRSTRPLSAISVSPHPHPSPGLRPEEGSRPEGPTRFARSLKRTTGALLGGRNPATRPSKAVLLPAYPASFARHSSSCVGSSGSARSASAWGRSTSPGTRARATAGIRWSARPSGRST